MVVDGAEVAAEGGFGGGAEAAAGAEGGVPGLLLGRGVPGLLPTGEATAEEGDDRASVAASAFTSASDSGVAAGGVSTAFGPTGGGPAACAGSCSSAGSSCTRTTQQSWSFSNTVTSEPSQSYRGMRESH